MAFVLDHYQSDGVRIAYRLDMPDESAADIKPVPVLLIHGFASNHVVNWVNPSWTTMFARAGYRTISIDNRGHGASEKLYDRQMYSAPLMARDAVRLLDHLDVEQALVMGYSMGARITAFMLDQDQERIRAAVFAGMGINMVRGLGGSAPIAEAFEADSPRGISDSKARSFRIFAESTGGDLKALAACLRGPRIKVSKEMLARIERPVLIVVGTSDEIAGSASELAALVPGSRVLPVEGRDHMKTVGDPRFKQGVLTFFDTLL